MGVDVIVFDGICVSVAVLVELGIGVFVHGNVTGLVAAGDGKGLNAAHPVMLPMRNMTITVSRNFRISFAIIVCFPRMEVS